VIFYFSKKPLRLATTLGFAAVVGGFLLALWIVYNKLRNPQYLVAGWPSVILTIVFFGGVQLITIGILGQYIGSLFDEIKRRPEYIVAQAINFNAGQSSDFLECSLVGDQPRPNPDSSHITMLPECESGAPRK